MMSHPLIREWEKTTDSLAEAQGLFAVLAEVDRIRSKYWAKRMNKVAALIEVIATMQ